MLRKLLPILLSSLLFSYVNAEQSLDWQSASTRLLNQCCLLQIAADKYDAAEYLKDQSLAWPNPELAFEYERYPGERSDEANEVSIEVAQLFELGGKRKARYRLADSELNKAAWEWESAKIHLLNELAHAFVDAASAQAKADLSEQQGKSPWKSIRLWRPKRKPEWLPCRKSEDRNSPYQRQA